MEINKDNIQINRKHKMYLSKGPKLKNKSDKFLLSLLQLSIHSMFLSDW